MTLLLEDRQPPRPSLTFLEFQERLLRDLFYQLIANGDLTLGVDVQGDKVYWSTSTWILPDSDYWEVEVDGQWEFHHSV